MTANRPSLAITLDFCQEIGGSNVVMRDIAGYFVAQGWRVCLFALRLSKLVRARFAEIGCDVVDVGDANAVQLTGEFDVFWGAHWTVYGRVLLEGNVQFRNLFIFSMSPYADFERLEFMPEEADLLIVNSVENSRMQSIRHKRPVHVLVNALPEKFFEGAQLRDRGKSLNIAYIGNHRTPELHLALNLLAADGHRITRAGRSFRQIDADEAFIDQQDVIVSIGHSVQKAIARKRPIYIYDRFGGPGYLTPEILESSELLNFSGRPHEVRSDWIRAPQVIAGEIGENTPDPSVIEALYSYAKGRFQLEAALQPIMAMIDRTAPFRRVEPEKYAFQRVMARHRFDAFTRKGNVVPLLDLRSFPAIRRRLTHLEQQHSDMCFFRLDALPHSHPFHTSFKTLTLAGVAIAPEPGAHVLVETDDGLCFAGFANLPSPDGVTHAPSAPHASRAKFQVDVAASEATRRFTISLITTAGMRYECAHIALDIA